MRRNLSLFFALLLTACSSPSGGDAGPTAVQSVTLSPNDPFTLILYAVRQLTATPMVDGQAATGRSIAWSSSDQSVASVSSSGVVRGEKAGNATITATSEGKSASVAVTVNHPFPSLISLSPSGTTPGSGAFTLTVNGDNFVNGTTVHWNGSARTTTYVSSTRVTAQITAADVASAGNVNVTAVSPGPGGGTSSAIVFSIASQANPAPTLTTILPTSATAGGAAFTLTINGTGFVAASVVRWNGNPRTTTRVSSTELTAAILATDLAAAGSVNITVFTPAPGGGTSSAQTFTITAAPAAAPTLATISPQSVTAGGSAFMLTATGTAFTTTSVVRVNGANRTTTFVSATSLTAQITAADVATAGTKNITIFTPAPGGGTSTAKQLTILAAGGNDATISVGGQHVCGTRSDGTPFCWGAGVTGRLGNGATIGGFPDPVTVSGGHLFKQISAGTGHSCGVTTAGEIWCWGYGAQGQLGNGGTSDQTIPVKVNSPLVFTQVSVSISPQTGGPNAVDFTCGLVTTGAAYCWGSNTNGALGIGGGDVGNHATPVAVAGGLLFTTITTGAQHACALTGAGAAYCWGTNVDGALGHVGNTIPTPALVDGGLTFAAISAGVIHTCAVTTSSAAYCWGNNGSGRIGNGTTLGNTFAPTAVGGGKNFSAISAGETTSCGVTTAREAYCWGRLPGGADAATPVLVGGGVQFKSISTGSFGVTFAGSPTTCGIATNNAAWCWGLIDAGMLGDGTTEFALTPSAVQGGLQFSEISALGQELTCGLTTAGVPRCWGRIMTDNNAGTSFATPQTVPGSPPFTALKGGTFHTCGITGGASVACWGSGNSGALGGGSLSFKASPIAIADGSLLSSLWGSGDMGCAITFAGALHCWGRFATLSDMTIDYSAIPTTVGSGTHIAGGGGRERACVIKTGGAVWCWGRGPVGDGTTANRAVPTAISSVLTFTQVTAGLRHSCGLTTAGAIYCWGENTQGQLGDGTTTTSNVPVKVSSALTFTALTAGDRYTCAIAAGGAAYCWGQNAGVFGNGNTTNSSIPVAVSGGLAFQQIAGGNQHTCGVTTAGAGYCWGRVRYGRLGNGQFEYRVLPGMVEW